jgi:septum formation protein
VTAPFPLVLASASPRRAALLDQLGLEFRVDPSHIHEEILPGESPELHVRRLSEAKALEVHARHRDALVLAGDTVVVMDGQILGKPRTPRDAVGMLLSLSGRTHRVVSGLALAFPGGAVEGGVMTTEVTFRDFGAGMAEAYVATGEPMDKAGAYGIQGFGGALVREIRGDYNTVVGLPVPLLLDLLAAGGVRYLFGVLLPLSREA